MQRNLPPRLVWYGREGIGKTTFGAGAENPIFVCTEEGADNLPVAKYDFGDGRILAESWEEILGAVQDIAAQDHDYKTIVIDTWCAATLMAAQKVCVESFDGKWADKNYGFLAWGGKQGYGATTELVRGLQRHLDKCRARGMMVILLSHESLGVVKDAVRGEYHQFIGDVDTTLWNVTNEWADIVGHAYHDFAVIENRDAKEKPKKGRAYNKNRRMVRFAGSPAEAAKCRAGYELPDEMLLPDQPELTYSMFADALKSDQETLSKVKALWGLLGIDEVKATLEWLGTTRLENAESSKLRDILSRLEEKAKETEDVT